ncbi:ABC transporter substrate-binding protein [Streptomyces sp. NPDC014801]|uniref:ABC transporter substrate-binding protein n=1 Tax=Streptomyces sp. NPDC014801 TaxID=3364916 RepID=UPI0036FD2B71
MEELGAADPRRVGRYRILARLGAGGMGRVYLGRSTSGRMVAVKVVRAELAEDPEFRRRFAREVEAARRVTGFFTAAVVDADPEGSPAWLATAYVPGIPLDEAVRAHGAWPRRSLLVLGAGLAEALEAIHGTGLIHRDLKPSNVLLAGDGPRVIDFGISLATEASALTQTGMVIGTPGFMSPEQVTGRTIGTASDVFALGAVLAYAGTGAAPFGTGSPHSVNFRAVYEQPDLRGLPAGTEFVGRLLEKDPERRPTVQQLLADFAHLLAEADGHGPGDRLPLETDWLPAAVARALTERNTTAPPLRPPVTAPPTPDPRVSLAKRPEPPVASPAATGEGEPAPGTPTPQEASTPGTPPPGEQPTPGTPPPTPGEEPTPGTPTPRQEPTPATPAPREEPTPATPAPGEAPAPAPPSHEPFLLSTSASAPVTAPRPGRSRRRRVLALALAAALVTGGSVTALLAQRGGDRPVTPGGTPRASAAASGFDAAVAHVVDASDRKGGTLRLVSSADADSWDPARSYFGWVWNMERLYTRTLLTYDVKPGKPGLTLVPGLAAAAPRVSADGRTYTVTLRSGVTFEDGTPITAQDVKYAIERVFAREVIDGGPSYLIETLDQGQGYPGPYRSGASDRTGLRSVETPDDRTLVFRLAEPDARFPHLLAMGATAPVPRKRDNGAGYAGRPVSSGPYRFQSYTPGKSLVLVRNEHWDRATDPLRKALPDRIELTVTSADDVAARLLDGRADLDVQQAGLTQAAEARVLRDPALKAHADAPFTGYLRTVALVSRTAPLDNAHCRRAVFYAADTTALRAARGGPTTGSLHGNLLPPTLPGSDGYDPFALTRGRSQPDKAREELRACGRPRGFGTKLVVRDARPQDVRTAVALQQSLKAVGITVAVDRLELDEYFSVIGSPAEIAKKGYGMMLLAWGADFPDGSGFLPPLTDGRLITPAGNVNYAGVNDPAVNALLDQAAAQTDPVRAAELYRRVDHRVTDGAYYLPVVADKALNYRGPRLTNVYVHQAYGMVDFQALGVADGK